MTYGLQISLGSAKKTSTAVKKRKLEVGSVFVDANESEDPREQDLDYRRVVENEAANSQYTKKVRAHVFVQK